jgi:outer membrane lipoprotein SlyB
MKIKETLIIALAGLIFLTLTGPIRADTYDKEEVDGYLKHVYTTVETEKRVANRVCNEVDVPIYKNSGKSTTGEVLGGAIIGGVIGNQIGKGKGNDAATILGAILGADFANKKGGEKTIVGYKRTTVCENKPTSVTEERKVYQYSTLRFQDKNGFQYDINFIRHEEITD